jgi:hypothetical protein
MSTFHETLEAARRWGEEHYPNASPQKHAAFANSVTYAAYRMSGGYGGPSIREHAANKALNDSPVEWQDRTEQEIYQFVAPFCYGPLTSLHREVWDDKRLRDISFDNDPADVAELNRYHLN